MRTISEDTLDEAKDRGGISEPSSTFTACGPQEPHPCQAVILLDKGYICPVK